MPIVSFVTLQTNIYYSGGYAVAYAQQMYCCVHYEPNKVLCQFA